MEVTVKDGKIAAVKADTSGETEGYGRGIGSEMANRILQKGSSDVDGVSGATITSGAIRPAAENALRQAGLSNGTRQKLRLNNFHLKAEPWTQQPHGRTAKPLASLRKMRALLVR